MIEVTKGGMQYLSNLTKDEKAEIKKDLTLDNPAYQQVKQFSQFRYTRVPPHLMFYTKAGSDLVVPRGYEIPFKYKVISDDRVESKIAFPKFKIDLRSDQQLAFDAWNENREHGSIIMNTGKGKSILGCYLAYATKQKTLIIIQKSDLLVSWTSDMVTSMGIKPNNVGIIKAGKFKIGSQFTVATIQSLVKLPPEKLRKLYTKFGMVIIDEFHHVSAKSYEILKYFQSRYMIGLTATDNRGDGLRQVLYWTVGDVCFRSENKAFDEDIMPYSVKVRHSNLKYNPPQMYYCGKDVVTEDEAQALKEAGKYIKRKPLDPQELKALLKDPAFNKQVARDIIHEYKANKSCIAFLHEKEHIRTLKGILINLGANKDHIGLFYGDAKEKDSEIIRKAEEGIYKITLATFAKATEGTNVKRWDTAFLVTSINDEKNTEQAVGRIRRRKKGKTECIVYDYAHPNVKGMKNHINTRLKVYKKHQAKIFGLNKRPNIGTISRGWKR
jgi:superfamily II DNA or RNA helicase